MLPRSRVTDPSLHFNVLCEFVLEASVLFYLQKKEMHKKIHPTQGDVKMQDYKINNFY